MALHSKARHHAQVPEGSQQCILECHHDRSEEGRGKEEKPPAQTKLSTKDYEKELARLHVELVKLQEWVVRTGAKVCVLFEGRDGAGKGGTIKALTERVSPHFPGDRPARPRPIAKDADVHAALPAAPAGGR